MTRGIAIHMAIKDSQITVATLHPLRRGPVDIRLRVASPMLTGVAALYSVPLPNQTKELQNLIPLKRCTVGSEILG